jgi:hypothetical protein
MLAGAFSFPSILTVISSAFIRRKILDTRSGVRISLRDKPVGQITRTGPKSKRFPLQPEPRNPHLS